MKNYGFKIIAFCLGIVLLACAAMLSLALLLPRMGIEVQNTVLQKLDVLFLFYGFSAFAIPVIILFFAIVLIAPVWNAKLNFICISTPLYFFTLVFFERLAIFLAGKLRLYNSASIIYSTCFLVGFLVIALEIALAVLLAEKLNVKDFSAKPDADIYEIDIIGATYTGTGDTILASDNTTAEQNESNFNTTAVQDTQAQNIAQAENAEAATSITSIQQETPVPGAIAVVNDFSDDGLSNDAGDSFNGNDDELEHFFDDELHSDEFDCNDEQDTDNTAKNVTALTDTAQNPRSIAGESTGVQSSSESGSLNGNIPDNTAPEQESSSLLSSLVVLPDETSGEQTDKKVQPDLQEDESVQFDVPDDALYAETTPAPLEAGVLTAPDKLEDEGDYGEIELDEWTDDFFDNAGADDGDEEPAPPADRAETDGSTVDDETDLDECSADDVPENTTEDGSADFEPPVNADEAYGEESQPADNTDDEITVTDDEPADKIDSLPNEKNAEEADVLSDGDSADAEAENDLSKKSTVSTTAFRPNALKYEYSVPSSLLTTYPDNQYWVVDEKTRRDARILKETLREFKIDVEIKGITKGPVVTMFELMPPPGIKLSKITGLQDNIALRLAAPSVRIVAPIPGKEAVGIEVPNENRAIVSMRELIEADTPQLAKMAVPVLLGKDITGRPQTMDIAQTPHLLIAGATGSGKSVCVNSIILSILYNRTPEQVRLLLVDPKIVELKLYNGIAHLLAPVITEPKKAFQALQYCLCEMERRYALLDGMSVRDIKTYNAKIKREGIAAETLPYIVIIIDEFADLMVTTGKELESTVARLCAMSRAVGIHLVLATQRPSINVITGLIKANIPTRIAFMVASNADSRIILDESGAEKLLGKGDMLYVSITNPFPVRLQGTFVSDTDVERVVEHVKTLRTPEYIDDEIFIDEDEQTEEVFIGDSDPLYDKALEIVLLEGKASASYLQRRLKIGYNRAARIVEEMYDRGVVGPANGSKPREVIYNQ